MARSRRRLPPKSKIRSRFSMPARRVAPAPALPAEPQAAALSQISDEVQRFGRKRLGKLMAASSRMMAARDMGDAAVVQSQYLLDAIDDYVSETARVAQLWMRAAGDSWSMLGSAQAAGGRLVRRRRDLGPFPPQSVADLAMTSAVVH